MKNTLKTLAIAAILSMQVAACAKADMTPTAAMGKEGGMRMACPMMGTMQNNMLSMMQEMDSMIGGMNDPAMKERMKKLRDQMGSMMSGMQGMGGMMGQGMMGNDMQKDEKSKPAVNPEEHKKHHPAQ